MPSVFNDKCDRHKEFRPVKEWIEEGIGHLVFGGTKYKKELGMMPRYSKLVRLLRDGGRAISIMDSVVDGIEAAVCKKTTGTDCDDQHIIALLVASRCPLLCSGDSRLYPFIKDRSLFPKKSPKVKIYTSSKQRKLLGRYAISPESVSNRE